MTEPTYYLLCSTYHDPEFRLKELIQSASKVIKKCFLRSIICLTPYTPKNIYDFLIKEGFLAIYEPSDKQIDTYKTALRYTLETLNNEKNQKVFHVDFDRLIHWINNYPDELINVLQNHSDVDYLHVGRTSRAFNTHPETQKLTEGIVNEIGSKILGLDKPMDIISVCYVFTKLLGEKLLKVNNSTTTGFYGSWPIYLWNWANNKRYVEVEGQEWETPDRFKKEIANLGYEKWMNQFQTHQEWNKRVKFLRECLFEFSNCTDFTFNEHK